MSIIKPGDMHIAIRNTLDEYNAEVIDKIDAAGEKAAESLVKKTKATAPVGTRGKFRKNISSKRLARTLNGSTYVWYVKGADYRLTHLLVHGHAKVNGGRTRADPFLANALSEVLPEYEKKVKEAIKGG